ncbi:MAG: ATP phosphoribosyltransferase regulatory subunit [Angelakisella sp.]
MRYYNKITPEGTGDLLFEECAARDAVAGRLGQLFRLRGYRKVATPALEFYDVFGSSAAYLPQEEMYKLTDNRGRLMVVRPDCTIPIARLTATRLSGMPMPLRLYYDQNVYRACHDLSGKQNEIPQTGVELIGSSGLRSDLEVVELAAQGLAELGGAGYRIELCHIGYFRALIDSLAADPQVKEQIRQSVEQKNYAALTDLLSGYQGAAAAALNYLPRLFGGEEVFDKAYSLFSQNGAADSLDYLRSIYRSLCELGLAGQVIIDLGLVNQAEYYTGLIFRGYCDGIGEPVLSGGRYDRLHGDFGTELPATGFAFNLALATDAAPKTALPPPTVLVFSDSDRITEAVSYIRTLSHRGVVAESNVCDTLAEAEAYCRSRGIGELHLVGDSVQIITLSKGGA